MRILVHALSFVALGLGFTAQATAQQTCLTTTFASNNGQSGNMFDIRAINPVTIDSFDVNLDPGTWDLEVYIVIGGGPIAGHENTPGDWSLVGSATGVVSLGTDVPTPLPIPIGVNIGAGQIQGFYVTVTNGTAINYTNGTTTGALFASDANIEFFEGSGHSYPFGSNFNPRIWNGNICYSPQAECFLLLGFRETRFNFGNDTLLVEPLLVIPMTLSNLPVVNVPNNPQLVGTTVRVQSFMYNPVVYPGDPIMVSDGLAYNIGTSTTAYGPLNRIQMWPVGSLIAMPGGQIAIGFSLP